MNNGNKKDFNKMLNVEMQPKIVTLDDDGAAKWGGRTMVVATKLDYDRLIKLIPEGKLVTTKELRENLARKYGTDITCPLTAGIFTNIVAWASFQRDTDTTPFWRVVKAKGELNNKYPNYPELQKSLLEAEGFTVIEKRGKYYVQDYEKYIFNI